MPRVSSARTHLAYELLDSLVDGILVKVELGGHALGLVCESHAALRLGVERALEFDLLFRLRTDLRLLEDEGVAESDAWRGDSPMLRLREELSDRVRNVGRKELDADG
jgi:hypothetical protein